MVTDGDKPLGYGWLLIAVDFVVWPFMGVREHVEIAGNL
jgi:hypothetical protein